MNCVPSIPELPNGQMIQFSLFNIPIRVLPWFWLTLAFIGGAFRADTKEAIFQLLLFMLAGFISILVHELGHGLTAKRFGKQVEIVLQAFGGYAAYSGGGRLSRVQTFLITAAGPAIQILLGGAALGLILLVPGLSFNGKYFFMRLCEISFLWAVLNLIPVLPMDGGRIMETLLGPERIRLTLKISIGVAVTVGLLALQFRIGMLLPIFMGLMAYECYKSLRSISWR
jgi:stage IV sporulation protein FB